jgi:hypothetical protein
MWIMIALFIFLVFLLNSPVPNILQMHINPLLWNFQLLKVFH